MTTTVPENKRITGISQHSRSAFRNPWALAIIGILVTFLGVNVYMISMAYTHPPALVDKDFYIKGREIEEKILSRRAEWESLGWRLDMNTPQQILSGQKGTYRLMIHDHDGKPVTGAAIKLLIQRPVVSKDDFAVEMVETVPGQYLAETSMPQPGLWDLVAEIGYEGQTYSQSLRINARSE